MNYECKCIPIQQLPHITKSSGVGRTYFFWFIHLFECISPAKSCDEHPVPQNKWRLYIGNRVFKFGKIIY